MNALKRRFEKWKQKGAVAPSSRFLARAITAHVEPSDRVLEIGAGNGVFTERLARDVSDDRLHVLEIDPEYEQDLRAHAAHVYVTDALDFLASPPLDLDAVKVISGLPLLNFEEAFRKTLLTRLLLESEVESLRQFTYSPLPLFTDDWLRERGLRARRAGFVLLNLPPAFIWEYTNHD
jgi:phosphatidylethanolamine/phosphatidyl-N-methylethanolamine N-methyltransferase